MDSGKAVSSSLHVFGWEFSSLHTCVESWLNYNPTLLHRWLRTEEDSKRKRSVEDAGGDRFAIGASMKECFDDSEPKPKPTLRLKLPAPKVKRRRQCAYPKQSVRRRSRPQLQNIDFEGIMAAQNQLAAQVGLEEWNKQQQAKNVGTLSLSVLVTFSCLNSWDLG
ncbi:hypothetical protein Ancab_001274 [Ancistrocladus abbreviatus]